MKSRKKKRKKQKHCLEICLKAVFFPIKAYSKIKAYLTTVYLTIQVNLFY